MAIYQIETEDGAIYEVETVDDQVTPYEPKTVAGKVLETTKNLSKDFLPFPTSVKDIPTALSSPFNPLLGLEKHGRRIKVAGLAPIEKGMDIAASTPLKFGYPKTGAAIMAANELFFKPGLRTLTPFTPSEFGNLGSMAMVPPVTGKPISPKLGKAYMESIIPSSPSEIRHAQKYLKKDAADLVLERPHLGNSRSEILKNSRSGIEDFEGKIKGKLNSSAKRGDVIERDEISRSFDKVISKAKKTGLEKNSVKILEELRNDFDSSHPKTADVSYWNDIKRSLHDLVGDKGYIAQSPSFKIQAIKSLANAIKTRIEKIIPGIKDLNSEQGALLDIRDSIIQSSPREVRDATLYGPLKEIGAILGSKFLSKQRDIPDIRPALSVAPSTIRGLRLPYDQDIEE